MGLSSIRSDVENIIEIFDEIEDNVNNDSLPDEDRDILKDKIDSFIRTIQQTAE